MDGCIPSVVFLTASFAEVIEEFTAKLMDKLELPLEDSGKFKIQFSTKWAAINTRTTAAPKKATAPINPTDFADFKRESSLISLTQIIHATTRVVRGKLNTGSKQLLVLAKVTDAERAQGSAKATEQLNLEDENSVLMEENRQVFTPYCNAN